MSKQKIIIGEGIWTREEWFREEEAIQKERAGLPLEEKIRILVEMQKLARSFRQKEGVFVWEIEEEAASPSLRSPQAPNSIY